MSRFPMQGYGENAWQHTYSVNRTDCYFGRRAALQEVVRHNWKIIYRDDPSKGGEWCADSFTTVTAIQKANALTHRMITVNPKVPSDISLAQFMRLFIVKVKKALTKSWLSDWTACVQFGTSGLHPHLHVYCKTGKPRSEIIREFQSTFSDWCSSSSIDVKMHKFKHSERGYKYIERLKDHDVSLRTTYGLPAFWQGEPLSEKNSDSDQSESEATDEHSEDHVSETEVDE